MAQHAGRRFSSAPGTLLLLAPNEGAGFSNHKSTSARLLVLNFRVGSGARAEFRSLIELASHERVITISPSQQRVFCDFLFKIAFEQGISSPVFPGSGTAASAWLAIALTSVMRWIFASRGATQLPEVAGEVDRACFDLWRTIHRHAHQGNAAEPMLLSQNPAHDSLRHRFRKFFGISPHSLLVRLRMERGKDLLRASNLSVKEIAQEIGYCRQHEFARAFRRHFGITPSEWRRQGAVNEVMRANGQTTDSSTTSSFDAVPSKAATTFSKTAKDTTLL